MTAEASARGAANRRKGHDTERRLAVYLRTWWPEARRTAAAGWRSASSSSADLGDITGTPGIVWQAKHVARLDVDKAMRETATQTVAAGADYGVLVQRRTGHANPGEWWAWVSVSDVGSLLGVQQLGTATVMGLVQHTAYLAPVRLELASVVTLLRNAGYGAPLAA